MSHEYDKPEAIDMLIDSYEHQEVELPLLPEIERAYADLRELLPALPKTVHIVFEGRDNYDAFGMDGYAIAPDKMGLAVEPDPEKAASQRERVRPLIFHEGYHMRQGFTYAAGPVSALQAAIYEGSATVFEREYAGTDPKWGNYAKENPETLERWLAAIKTIDAEQYFEPSGETWRKWAFYDEETDESWRIYKVGTWIVDDVLKRHDLDITDLAVKSAEEIFKLYSAA